MTVGHTGPSEAEEVPWRRILWTKQPYPDNYVSHDFLKNLQSGPPTQLPTFRDLVIYSLPLSQHFNTTLLFVGSFLHLQQGNISSESLAACSALCIVLCASTTGLRDHTRPPAQSSPSRPLAQPLVYALLCLVTLALSPLLKTLTEATTGDSIAALSTALFLLSFALADYSSPAPSSARKEEEAPQLPATLSLNASLCASIVLASRLESPIEAFSLLLFSIFLFAFLPRWVKRRILSQANRPALSLLYTIALTSASCSLLASFSLTSSFLNAVTAGFLSLICPAWMRRAQGWKQGRRGPWDVGVPRFSSR